MTLPCPKCGSEEIVGTFCKDCLQELHPLVEEIGDAEVLLCASCDRVHMHGTWKEMDEESLMAALLDKALSFSQRAEIAAVGYDPLVFERKPGLQRTIKAHAKVTGKDEDADEEYTETYDVPVRYSVTVCKNCKTRQPSYYEGILQVRNEDDTVQQEINEYLQEHPRVHCTKMQPAKNGTDYYLSDNRAVGHLARHLHKRHGGILKVNAQHFSEDKQKGKILYRTNALVELPEYGKHDVILRNGKPYLVIGLSDRVKAECLEDGSEESFPYGKGQSAMLPAARTQVVRTEPLEVLHPETYQAVRPGRSKYAPTDLEVDEHVRATWYDGQVFILPPTVSGRQGRPKS